MSTLDLSALRSAMASLDDGLAVVGDSNWFSQQDERVRNTLVAGVIQNFEFVYEISVKMLRRQLEAEADTPAEIDQAGFRDLLRLAAEKGLISDVEAWFGFRQMRNITAHTHDHAKAQQVYQGTQAFLIHARQLLAQLEARHG
ncbi:MAG: nucleotidyltransferase substrate binding protein [Burkholderiales bacterium]|nr:nucleotidyltransferase substrate binding protein [Burkholderiales bacterium]MBH2016193.1 nucleotidyltransferase substrate binding protein [Burkholderiales bacterium]